MAKDLLKRSLAPILAEAWDAIEPSPVATFSTAVIGPVEPT